ncbi:MAG: cytochrome P450 [Mesorhizobium sp.]|nr:MAG: cytochrome P450 [Mesorhizobium sp.]
MPVETAVVCGSVRLGWGMLANRLGKWRSLGLMVHFAAEPLTAARNAHRAFGPFIQAEYPHSTSAQPRRVFMIADAALYRAMLSDTETWRNIQINGRGKRGHASHRLSYGMTRLRGERHEHYRRLFAPPLKRPAIMTMSPEMARIAADQVSSWPVGKPFSLTDAAKTMAKHLAIGLLFGDDRARAMPIAEMIARQIRASWIVPGPAFFSWIREAEVQERAILAWAEEKRGNTDAQDILSILVNNTDEAGRPPSVELIGGIISFVFGAAYDTCQNALAWTLILLNQHPDAMAGLAAEIDAALDGKPATMDRIGSLPLLDATIKEAMRLFPPVPLMMRKATRATRLGDEPIARHEGVLISALTINRDPSLYPNPDSFQPERWASIKPSPFQYTVFGAGSHMCPGVTFGLQMMKIALATILSKRSVELAPGARISYRTRVTLAPIGNVQVIMRERGGPALSSPAHGRFRELVSLPATA